MRQQTDLGSRYAIYFVPFTNTQLYILGCRWLGRNSLNGKILRQPRVKGISPVRMKKLTADPRFYGFHGTLKPPFFLRRDQTEQRLMSELKQFCESQKPFQTSLKIGEISGFFALIENNMSPETQTLAEQVVSHFDDFRASPTSEELKRRRKAQLNPAQETNLVRWGYPYVMDQFRFHMTLSCKIIDPEEKVFIQKGLKTIFSSALDAPLIIDAVTLFSQDKITSPFLQIGRYPFEK